MYCMIVKANTMRNEAFMVARLIGSAMSKRVVHEAKLKRCLVYINIKQVEYIGSSVAAVNISTMARPARK